MKLFKGLSLGFTALILVFLFVHQNAFAWNFHPTDKKHHPTATPTPTVAEELVDCDHDGDAQDEDELKECEPTPTVEVTPTETQEQPTPTETPCTQNCGTTPTFPHDIQTYTSECVGNPPKAPSFVHVDRVSSTSVRVEIAETDPIDHFIVSYGYVGEGLTMGIPSLPREARVFTIDGLQPDRHINVHVSAEGENHCVSGSETDP